MAGDWIKWTKGLHRKREVMSMAAGLGISTAAAAGACMIFWEWLDDNTSAPQVDEQGNAHVTLGALRAESLDALVQVPGFAAALAAEGWLNIRTGSLVVPNYSRHNGQTAKDRALTAERVAKNRNRKEAQQSNAPPVTNVTVAALPEKRREDIHLRPKQARELPKSLADVLAAAERFTPSSSVPLKPDPGFCEWWFDGQESAGWMDPQSGFMWHDWQAAFFKAWRGSSHNKLERKQRIDHAHKRPGYPGSNRNAGTANACESVTYAGIGRRTRAPAS